MMQVIYLFISTICSSEWFNNKNINFLCSKKYNKSGKLLVQGELLVVAPVNRNQGIP